MRPFSLDARLSTIEEMIPPCGVVADIGADHGRLGVHLLLSGRAERVVMLDISAPSLDKARLLAARFSVEDRAAFLVGDGARPLASPPDCAVIAGMGGETIAGIVEQGRAQLGDARLILEPNVAQYQLRERLMRAGYAIGDERIVRAGRRRYVILSAEPGRAAYDRRALLVGPILMQRRDEELFEYAAFQVRVLTKALAGAKSAKDPAVEALAWALDQWKEVESWRQR